jgi:hypothetical protein
MPKTQFVSLSESELKIGQPLPWAIYLRSGELLAPAGFVVIDSIVRDRLMGTRPVRIASNAGRELATIDAEESSDEKMARQTYDPLKYLKHNAEGTVLTFKLAGDYEPRNVQVEFYGCVPLQSIIVSAPALPGHSWSNLEGLALSVQVIFGRSLCVFKTSVLRHSPLPSGHLFLRYPTEAVTKPFRQSLRVEVKLPASITMPDGATLPAVITNISGSGCAIATGFVLGQPGTALKVSFRVKIGEKYHTVVVPCIIRSNKGKLSQQMRYGVAFDESADDAALLVLKSFVYEHLAER